MAIALRPQRGRQPADAVYSCTGFAGALRALASRAPINRIMSAVFIPIPLPAPQPDPKVPRRCRSLAQTSDNVVVSMTNAVVFEAIS
jgi:hypothetical protein